MITEEKLRQIVQSEKEKTGEHVYSDRRRTAEEMLRMMGKKL